MKKGVKDNIAVKIEQGLTCHRHLNTLTGFIPLIFSKEIFLAFRCFLVLKTMENPLTLFIFVVKNFLCFYFSLQN